MAETTSDKDGKDKEDVQGGIPETVKRENVVTLAFGGQTELFDEFCRVIEEVIR